MDGKCDISVCNGVDGNRVPPIGTNSADGRICILAIPESEWPSVCWYHSLGFEIALIAWQIMGSRQCTPIQTLYHTEFEE